MSGGAEPGGQRDTGPHEHGGHYRVVLGVAVIQGQDHQVLIVGGQTYQLGHDFGAVDVVRVGDEDPFRSGRGARGVYDRGIVQGVQRDRGQFLEHACLKAHLPSAAWQDPETEIWIFSADVFPA